MFGRFRDELNRQILQVDWQLWRYELNGMTNTHTMPRNHIVVDVRSSSANHFLSCFVRRTRARTGRRFVFRIRLRAELTQGWSGHDRHNDRYIEFRTGAVDGENEHIPLQLFRLGYQQGLSFNFPHGFSRSM